MPLNHNNSDEAFRENIRSLVNEGYPQKRAVAIAYSIKRRSGKHGTTRPVPYRGRGTRYGYGDALPVVPPTHPTMPVPRKHYTWGNLPRPNIGMKWQGDFTGQPIQVPINSHWIF
jgi:hypothetical protein